MRNQSIVNLLGEKIKKQLEAGKTYKQLGDELIVSPSVLCFIVKDKDRYYSEEILDYLYSMFQLKKDLRYFTHIKYKFKSPIANFFQKSREEKGLSVDDVCRKLKVSEKAIRRIENNKINYKRSKILKDLEDLYKLEDWEKKLIEMSF